VSRIHAALSQTVIAQRVQPPPAVANMPRPTSAPNCFGPLLINRPSVVGQSLKRKFKQSALRNNSSIEFGSDQQTNTIQQYPHRFSSTGTMLPEPRIPAHNRAQ